MSDFNRIAISGKICSGKTTVANMLTGKCGYFRMFFADELKKLCQDICLYNKASAAGVPADARMPLMEMIWSDVQRITTSKEEYEAAMQQVFCILKDHGHVTVTDVYNNKTDDVRKMLQEVGTEYMRNHVNPNIWVNALEKQISTAGNIPIVVDDMRHVNEYAMLRENGFVMVRLNVSKDVQMKRVKKLYGKVDESKFIHPSETELDHVVFDYVIDADQDLEGMLNDICLLIGGK